MDREAEAKEIAELIVQQVKEGMRVIREKDLKRRDERIRSLASRVAALERKLGNE